MGEQPGSLQQSPTPGREASLALRELRPAGDPPVAGWEIKPLELRELQRAEDRRSEERDCYGRSVLCLCCVCVSLCSLPPPLSDCNPGNQEIECTCAHLMAI